MSVVAPIREAREVLGIDVAAARDPAALKRAYREAVRRSPPDRDPEAFARVRHAYETLTAPVDAMRARLVQPTPYLEPPRIPERPVAKRGTTAIALLRVLVGTEKPHDAG